MTAAQLIARLQALPSETVVVGFHHGGQGYDEMNFLSGTHQTHEAALKTSDDAYLMRNRAKWVKGEPRPDFLPKPAKSRAAAIPFVVITL